MEKEYEFDTEDGKKTLAELFDGRSQLLAYNIMFGPDYANGACPGCTSLGDDLDGSLVHLNHSDVTMLCFSRAPIERLTAYKERMGWEFPYRRLGRLLAFAVLSPDALSSVAYGPEAMTSREFTQAFAGGCPVGCTASSSKTA